MDLGARAGADLPGQCPGGVFHSCPGRNGNAVLPWAKYAKVITLRNG